jgi:hypothetical protein
MDSQKRTARKGPSDRTARTEKPKQDSQNRTIKTRKPEQDSWNGIAEQDNQNRILKNRAARTEQPG